jgi:WD40 repeat protein
MATLRHARPGLREIWIVWGLFGLAASTIVATYARLPVRDLYNVTENGRTGGAGRALVFLNWPTALVAIAIAGVLAAQPRSRAISRLALAAIVLCAAVLWPGMVEQSDLDAKWTNVIAASGVMLAFALTFAATRQEGLGPRLRVRGDRARFVAIVILLALALPWMAADLGFLIGRWPVLGSIFYSDEWWARLGHARLHRAVHFGHHHGMDGTLLAITAIVLSRMLGRLEPGVRRVLGAYLGLLLVYGLALVANDFWLEQLVKRDVGVSWEVPSLLVPALSWSWLILLALAAIAYLALFRSVGPGDAIGSHRLLWPAACLSAIAALLVIGLLHGAHRHVTELASVDGIAFAFSPAETSHLFMTHDHELVQLTDGDDSELAPNWSRNGRLVFQSNRDGNWELYSMNGDGTGLSRLTDDDAADGEPHWSPDGKRIAFTRNADLYVMRANGVGARKVADGADWPSWSADGTFLAYESRSGSKHGVIGGEENGVHLASPEKEDLRYPAWSPRGKVFAYDCLEGDYWHICTLDVASGSQRVLTQERANDFAPAWSPDGTRIAFISDRDGNDQVFVMRADGTGIVRVTTGQAEKDTPAWRP